MSNLTQTLHDLPASGLLPVLLLVVTGLLLWAAGRKILRAGFAIIGLVMGGCAGWLVGSAVHIGVPAWVFALIGAAVAACVAALAFRFAVAAAMAFIFAVAAPLATLAYAEMQARRAGHTLAEGEARNPMTDEIAQWLEKHDSPEARQQADEAAKTVAESVGSQIDRAKAALSESTGGKSDEQIAHVEEFGRRMVESIRQQWDKTPPSLRPTLIISAVVGAVVGLILGIVAHSLSAAAITALGGSMLWLSGVPILAVRLGVSDSLMPKSGTSWLIVWLITSAVGFAIQWTFRRRRADKPA